MTYDYKCTSKCKRTKDGLIAHHKKEDVASMLSLPMVAQLFSIEWQLKQHMILMGIQISCNVGVKNSLTIFWFLSCWNSQIIASKQYWQIMTVCCRQNLTFSERDNENRNNRNNTNNKYNKYRTAASSGIFVSSARYECKR